MRARMLRLAYRLAALFGLVLIPACGAGAIALPPPARALCYAAADRHAQARVDAECYTAPSFAECPAQQDILAALKSEQEACK